jgi:hypothetical protein
VIHRRLDAQCLSNQPSRNHGNQQDEEQLSEVPPIAREQAAERNLEAEPNQRQPDQHLQQQLALLREITLEDQTGERTEEDSAEVAQGSEHDVERRTLPRTRRP